MRLVICGTQVLFATVVGQCTVFPRSTIRTSESRRLRYDAVCRQGRHSSALRTPLPDVTDSRLARSRSSRTSAAAGRRARLRVDGRGGGPEVPGRRTDECRQLWVPDGRHRDGAKTRRQRLRCDRRLSADVCACYSPLQLSTNDFQLINDSSNYSVLVEKAAVSVNETKLVFVLKRPAQLQ